MHRVIVTGQSGAGKTTLMDRLRESDVAALSRFTDLDWYGHRKNSEDWKEWCIPPFVLDFLLRLTAEENQSLVCAGISSNWDEFLGRAVSLKFTVLVLAPPLETVVAQATTRGDEQTKIDDIRKNYTSFLDYYEGKDYDVFTSSDDLFEAIRTILNNNNQG
jgi:broad-specificity NMP kinase